MSNRILPGDDPNTSGMVLSSAMSVTRGRPSTVNSIDMSMANSYSLRR